MKPTDQQINEIGRKYFNLHTSKDHAKIHINGVNVCFAKYDRFIIASFMRNEILTSLTIEI